MSDESKEFVVAADFDQLVTLFYSDIYFLSMEMLNDEDMAKGLAKKVFEIAEKYFDSSKNNNFSFVESIFRHMTSYVKSDEINLLDSGQLDT